MYIPPHITGQNYAEYQDVKKTLDEKGIEIGGYIRISTKKDSQKTSIENQKKLLEQWAEVNGYKLVRIYIDVKSGEYTYLRNDIQQMFEDAKAGRIKGVVSKEIARTSRDVMDIISIKRTLSDYGAFFISIKENYDSRTDDDEFLLILHGGLAQKERKTTSSRVKVTQLMKAKEGKTNVPLPAFGYMLSNDRQHLAINPKTAPIYRQIIEKFLSGWGQLKIAKWLNKQGIPTRRGGQWSTNAIRTILSNPVYLGITIYNASTLIRDSKGRQRRVIRPREEWIIRENTHEPLISEDEFNTIQLIMKQRKEKYAHEWSCDRKYLGSSILRCATCGGKIYGFKLKQKSKKKGNKSDYKYMYRCIGVNGKCTGKNKYWDMEIIDNNILSFITLIFSDKEKLLNFIKRNMDLITDDLNNLIEERRDLKIRIGRINEAIKKQQLAYEQDIITIEEYKDRMRELREDKQVLGQKLDDLNFRLEKIDAIDDKINRVFDQVNTYIENIHNLPQEEKYSLVSHFSEIYIDQTGNITDVKFRM
ncbi:recombinase family protein [Desulfoscipio geothermicus]|uniref:Site-specific DNA recombinase n=1 Tax=Desulfoscipio geothermicus DSM 3669 TaxID=1121426 RepID=A0A1I6EM91_9FIRM|nr:recombinase family protein [Desulfoscipio geothermicus]SFR18894.1 Site-specific DNA recombinase [Desulfoscipio geothermicus DSM 3669]